MSDRSVPHHGPLSQVPLGGLERLRWILPRRLEAADRGAMQFRRLHQKAWALKTFSEIWLNDDQRVNAIVVDADHEPIVTADPLTAMPVVESVAASSWLDAGCVPPNLVVMNPATGHAHLIWLLDDSIWCRQQPKAIRYARAIQVALGRAVGAKDIGSLTMSAHNPWSTCYQTRVVHAHAYRLDEIARGLDLYLRTWRLGANRQDDDPDFIPCGARNETIFRVVLSRSGSIMRRCRDEKEYEAALQSEATRIHGRCEAALDACEISCAVEWIIKHRPFRCRDRAAECRARRHAEGRSWAARTAPTRAREAEARRLRTEEHLTIVAIAERLGVTTRTVDRYLRDTRPAMTADSQPATILAIPIRDIAPVASDLIGQSHDSLGRSDVLLTADSNASSLLPRTCTVPRRSATCAIRPQQRCLILATMAAWQKFVNTC